MNPTMTTTTIHPAAQIQRRKGAVIFSDCNNIEMRKLIRSEMKFACPHCNNIQILHSNADCNRAIIWGMCNTCRKEVKEAQHKERMQADDMYGMEYAIQDFSDADPGL